MYSYKIRKYEPPADRNNLKEVDLVIYQQKPTLAYTALFSGVLQSRPEKTFKTKNWAGNVDENG